MQGAFQLGSERESVGTAQSLSLSNRLQQVASLQSAFVVGQQQYFGAQARAPKVSWSLQQRGEVVDRDQRVRMLVAQLRSASDSQPSRIGASARTSEAFWAPPGPFLTISEPEDFVDHSEPSQTSSQQKSPQIPHKPRTISNLFGPFPDHV